MTIGVYSGLPESEAQPELKKSLVTPLGAEDDAPARKFYDSGDVGAIFERNNPIASGVASVSALNSIDTTPDPNFTWVEEIVGSKYEPYSEAFFKADNRQMFEAVKADLDRQIKNQQIEDTSGWGSFVVGHVGSVLADPTILFPGGSFVKAGRAGYSAGKTALSVGAASGIATAASEGALQATQDTRSALESGTAIGGSFILGGLLGAGGAKLLSRAQFNDLSSRLEREVTEGRPSAEKVEQEIRKVISQQAQSGGAAAVEKLQFDELNIYGKAAGSVARASDFGLFPGIQAMRSDSVAVRRVYNDLVESALLNEAQAGGKSTGQSVETTLKYWQRGAQTKFLQKEKALYKAAKKDGYQGGRDDFAREVSLAARRGDEHSNPHVQAAAEAVRNDVFDPLLKRSKLPDGTTPDTARSYVTRLWNRNRLFGEEARAKQIFRSYFQESLEREFKRTEELDLADRLIALEDGKARVAGVSDRVAKLEKEVADRQKSRSVRLADVQAKEAVRRSKLAERLQPEIKQALQLDDDGAFIDLVKSAKSELAKSEKLEKFPLIGRLRRSGGVNLGSVLADELKNMGVSPRSFPGLFKKDGGLKDVDNWPLDELLSSRASPNDLNGPGGDYASREAILGGIADELAGNPWRVGGEASGEFVEAVESLLKELGLDIGAGVGEVRDLLEKSIRADKSVDRLDTDIGKLLRKLDEFDANTDKIKDRLLVTSKEAEALQIEVDSLGKTLAGVSDAQRRQPRVRNVLKMTRHKRDLASARLKRSEAQTRVKALELVEADGKLTDDLAMELNARRVDVDVQSSRVVKLENDIEELGRFMPTRGVSRDEFLSSEDLDGYLDEAVNMTFDNLVGRGAEGKPDTSAMPAWMVPLDRGPLKERVFKIDDELVEGFLENDIRFIVANYTRTMGAEVELTNKFGRADMADQFKEIADDYNLLRAEAGKIEDAATRLKEIKRLTNAEKRDVKNLTAFRDQARGTYRVAEQQGAWGKATRLALSWNYIRLLGGVTLSSASDAMRVVTSNGITPLLSEVIVPLATKSGRLARGITKQEAREAGAVVETYLNSRLATLAELDDPYASGSAFERLLANSTTMFSKATGLPLWNDVMKNSVATMTQNRIIRNATKGFTKLNAKEKRYMAKLGLDENASEIIAANFKTYGKKEGPTHIAGISNWTEDDRIILSSALNKAADQVVVTKGIGDTPLFMHGNAGKLIMQFKSFALASHQRVLLSGLQDNRLSLLSFLVGGTAIGMLVSYLKLIERGDYERAESLTQNWGRWVSDGIDRTGIFAVPFDILNTADKVFAAQGGPGIGTAAIGGLIAQDNDASGGATRYVSRNPLGAVLGPTAGMFGDITTIMSQAAAGDVKKSGANAMVRQVPGGTLPGVRTGLHEWIKPMLQDSVK